MLSCQIAHLNCGTTSTAITAESFSPLANQLCALNTLIPQPALSSPSEESHFNLVHKNLIEIKDRLEKLENVPQPHISSFEVCVVTTERNTSSELTTIFQNEPSLNNQSAQASISAELSAEEANVTNFELEIQASLKSLKSGLQGQSVPSTVNSLYFPCSSSRSPTESVQLPPMPLVLAALKKATSLL